MSSNELGNVQKFFETIQTKGKIENSDGVENIEIFESEEFREYVDTNLSKADKSVFTLSADDMDNLTLENGQLVINKDEELTEQDLAFSSLVNELLNDSRFILTINKNNDDKIDIEEVKTYLESIKGKDGDTSNITLDDIIALSEAASEDTEKTNYSPDAAYACDTICGYNYRPVGLADIQALPPKEKTDSTTNGTNNDGKSDGTTGAGSNDSNNTPGIAVPEEMPNFYGNENATEEQNEAALQRAKLIYEATQVYQHGANKEAVRHVLLNSNLNDADIMAIINAYEYLYGDGTGDALLTAIQKDFSWVSNEGELTSVITGAKKGYDSTQEGTEVTQEDIYELQIMRLKNATEGAGTTEEGLNDLILNTDPEDLKDLIEWYNAKHGTSAFEAIVKGDAEDEYEKVLMGAIEAALSLDSTNNNEEETKPTDEEQQKEWQKELAYARAMTLHAALERGGTDAKVVESILINETNNADLFAVIEAYEDLYGNLDNCNYNNNKYALYDHIAFDFSFGKEDELLGMLKNAIDKHDQQKQTEIPKEQAEQTIALARALAIFEATEARNGTDESVVNEILTSLSDEELRLMAQQCPNVGEGRSLVELIKGDYSGEIEKALLTKLEKAGITA